jgi:hypothetical protein
MSQLEAISLIEASKQALEALEECRRDPRLKYEHPTLDKALTSLRQAIAEAEKQEPVAYVHADELEELSHCNGMSVWAENALAHTEDSLSKQLLPFGYVALYAHPQPKREPLTIEQLREHWQVARVLDMTDAEIDFADYVLIVGDVEALYGIKGEA